MEAVFGNREVSSPLIGSMISRTPRFFRSERLSISLALKARRVDAQMGKRKQNLT